MKNVIYFFLLFFTSVFLSVFAQHLTPLQEDVVRKTISAQFADEGNNRILNLGKDVFCVVGKDTLYNPDGYNYVFKLHHDSITRLDRSLYHGSNHNRFLFAHNGELCALGGYGFFTTNNNLQVFYPNVKEWLFKPTTGDIPNYISGLCFKIGDDVYNMNNFKSGNSTAPNLMDSSIYKLNLKTMVWERFYQIGYPSEIFGAPPYYTNQYSVLRGNLQTIIVKPSEFKFMLLNNGDFGIDNVSILYSSSDDKLFFNTEGNSRFKVIHYTIDLNATWKKHEGKAKSFNLIPIEKGNTHKFNNWFIISILLMITLIVGYFVMKQPQPKSFEVIEDAIPQEVMKETPIQTPTTESQMEVITETQTDIEDDLSDSLYTTLLHSEKTFFNGDELDEIFGIAHLEPDSKKSKRHRYLANLDKNHPGFVIRIKEQVDKRRFNYKIVK